MEKVINYLTGFFGGLMAVMMAIIPVTILWVITPQVLELESICKISRT